MAEQVVAKPPQESAPRSSMEEVIEASIGRMNCGQIIQAILVSIPIFFDNQQSFISVFTDAQPAWHCTNHTTTCNTNSYICNLSKSDWAWDGNPRSSIISEWGLECSSSFIKGLPATSYFAGSLLAGFVLASFGDSPLGRKNLVFISCLVMSLAAFSSAFSPNVWVYSLLRFICGAGRVSISSSAFVLLSERVGKRWRGHIVLLGFVGFTFGLLSMTAIAYLIRDSSWRALYLWTSIPAIICCTLTHFFLCESPRWLFMQGREKDALAALKRIGSIDRINPTLSFEQGMIIPNNRNPFSSLAILLRKRWALQRLLVSMILSFGMGLMYYGTFLGVGNLGLNIYLITTFNGLLFLSSSFISYLFWIPKCSRKTSSLGFCTISGVSSVISSLVTSQSHDYKKAIQVGLELVSLFCASMVFNILFMYVVEMFPTCVRNCATALSRQALLVASVFVPVLVEIGVRNGLVTRLVFGVGILLSGILVISLPETRGKVLCDTMEEQEARDKDAGCLSII